ncbi:SIR2 family protein [Coprobacillaceae bacterium CR2/5/TPMF4]|nr:SIR2 family protein [Coprobacillaceae bacterium CR2/5/TPMF4]
MEEFLNVDSEEFGQIFIDIKQRYLSNTNFPKLIVGTGLSISMNIPGMSALAKKLNKEFENIDDTALKETWEKYKGKIETDGLETALLDVSMNEELFIEKIREITSEFILDNEYVQHSNIGMNKSGFEKLIKYLSISVSENYPLIDIMTPNYDRIIELICDKLRLQTTLGFVGSVYQTFDSNTLKSPYEYYRKHITLVRIFKPHGSVNWIKKCDKEYQINDYYFLKDNNKNIDIVAPGRSKYEVGMVNDIFRSHREIFNELISDSRKDFSIFIYGYGFNDKYFNTVFENTEKK